MLDTLPYLDEIAFPALQRGQLTTLQVNLGYLCNQSCLHCHVAAGPNRSEVMDADTIDMVIAAMHRLPLQTLDLTGGAPELNPHFRRLVAAARELGLSVIDRCNLSVLQEDGQQDLAGFLARHEVELVASLPCYLEQNVDAQRGDGTFDSSISALQQLNALGYGKPGSGLRLNLVYNPQGASLPPDQDALERDYRQKLDEHYGIHFNRLLALANLPVGRFGSALLSSGEFDGYMRLLQTRHQPQNLASVMCRSLLSIDWRGFVYDCDFNQMLGLHFNHPYQAIHLQELDAAALQAAPINVSGHCYGCTAGQGSGCGGAL